jgi:hypothetical protein
VVSASNCFVISARFLADSRDSSSPNAVYSHMLLNMGFSSDELHFIFSEIKRVLKPKGLNFFSVRNHNDKFYGKGREVDKGIYDINGFQIRFVTEKEIQDLVAAEGFEILWIKEEYEEPVTLYLVSSSRNVCKNDWHKTEINIFQLTFCFFI